MRRTTLFLLPTLVLTSTVTAQDSRSVQPVSNPQPGPSAAPVARPAGPAASAPRKPLTKREMDEAARFATAVPTRPLSVVALESRVNAPGINGAKGQAAQGALTAVSDPEPRAFKVHDLITIAVSETSRTKSTANIKTDKKYDLDFGISQFINMDVSNWSDAGIQLNASDLPQFNLGGQKKLDSKNNLGRLDDFTAKITAEIIDVLPNGTVVLEAYKQIKLDSEEQTIRLSGRCRPEDIDSTNMVQSNRLANAAIEKVTKGQLKDASELGIAAKILNAIFAF